MLIFFLSFSSLFFLYFFFRINWLFVIFYLSFFCFFSIFFLYSPITSFSYVGYNIYIDLISSCMILLSIWITSIIFLARYKVEFSKISVTKFFFCIYILCLILLLTFFTNNVLLFYILFEVSLIPTVLLILG